MPPHIFEASLRVNTNVYLAVLKDKVLSWIKEIVGDRQWVWQQDSAPCYTSKRSMVWLQNNCYNLWSPLTCGLLTVLTLIKWIILSGDMLKGQPMHVTSSQQQGVPVVATIKEVTTNIDPVIMTRACCRFRHRIMEDVAAKGNFIEFYCIHINNVSYKISIKYPKLSSWHQFFSFFFI